MRTCYQYIILWLTVVAQCAITSASSSSDARLKSSFIFPDIKPDPHPVLLLGPAGELFNFTKTGHSTGNSYALAYGSIPPYGGPPGHIHRWTKEWLYFPEGGIVYYSSYEQYPDLNQIPNGCQLPKTSMHRYHTKPGDLLYGPPYYVHGYRNEDNVSRPLITVWSLDVISQYFFQSGQIVTDPYNLPPIGDINKQLFVILAPMYGMSMSSFWDEYAASWSDDLQPPVGMDANGQELLNLLLNTTVQNITFQPSLLTILNNNIDQNVTCLSSNTTAQTITSPLPVSHLVLLQPSFAFIYSMAFIVIQILSILS